MKMEAAPVNLVTRPEREDRGTPRQIRQRPSSPLRRRGGRQGQSFNRRMYERAPNANVVCYRCGKRRRTRSANGSSVNAQEQQFEELWAVMEGNQAILDAHAGPREHAPIAEAASSARFTPSWLLAELTSWLYHSWAIELYIKSKILNGQQLERVQVPNIVPRYHAQPQAIELVPASAQPEKQEITFGDYATRFGFPQGNHNVVKEVPVRVSQTMRLSANSETFVPCVIDNKDAEEDLVLISQPAKVFNDDVVVAPAMISARNPVLLTMEFHRQATEPDPLGPDPDDDGSQPADVAPHGGHPTQTVMEKKHEPAMMSKESMGEPMDVTDARQSHVASSEGRDKHTIDSSLPRLVASNEGLDTHTFKPIGWPITQKEPGSDRDAAPSANPEAMRPLKKARVTGSTASADALAELVKSHSIQPRASSQTFSPEEGSSMEALVSCEARAVCVPIL
ncbi:hypothetical protein GCK32_009090 [Trichostrongylus colubriformis]|uniref:Uncharacterized protein n=1 Tax=Trichostrongylus colubriformis TaxID=6319 RepID=A0AAN8IM60_TRICO